MVDTKKKNFMLVVIFILGLLSGLLSGYVLGNTQLIYSAIAYRTSTVHGYDYFRFNCVNFSQELQKGLYTVGADAKIVHGYIKEECMDWNSMPTNLSAEEICEDGVWCHHAWVRVMFNDGIYLDFEATNGMAIAPEVFNRCYRVMWVE